ncbi:MAG: ATP-binding protein [Thermoplasma acidophilum]|nr:ATP-binding protein [Thermoplasma acidophilum]
MRSGRDNVLRNVLAYTPEYYGLPVSLVITLIASASSFLILAKFFGIYAILAIPALVAIVHPRIRHVFIARLNGIVQIRLQPPAIIKYGKYTLIKLHNTPAIVAKMVSAYDNHAESFFEIASFIGDLLASGMDITVYSIPHAAERANDLAELHDKVYFSTYVFLWSQGRTENELAQSISEIPLGNEKAGLRFEIDDADIKLIQGLFYDFHMHARKNYISGIRNISIFSLIDAEKAIFPSYCEALEISDLNAVVKFSAKHIDRKKLAKTASTKIADITYELKQRNSRKENTEYLKSVLNSAEMLSNESRKGTPEAFLCSLDFMVMSRTPYGLKREISKLDRGLRIAGMRARNLSYRASRSVRGFFDFTRENIPYPMDASSVASFFPAYFSREETAGILLGINEYTGKPIYMDYFSHTSYNSIVTGETGSGKSYFAKVFSRRVFRAEYSKLLVLDPLNEYHCNELGHSCMETDLVGFLDLIGNAISEISSYGAIIIKYDLISAEREKAFGMMIAEALSQFMSKIDGRKTVIIDEANLVLKNEDALRLVENTVRHSRHFETSVFIITQSISDIRLGNTIEENSVHRFFFRTASSDDGFHKYAPGNSDLSELIGGKNRNFSECYYSYGGRYMKILITGANAT